MSRAACQCRRRAPRTRRLQRGARLRAPGTPRLPSTPCIRSAWTTSTRSIRRAGRARRRRRGATCGWARRSAGEPAYDPDFGVGDFPACSTSASPTRATCAGCARLGGGRGDVVVTVEDLGAAGVAPTRSGTQAGAAAAGQPVVVARPLWCYCGVFAVQHRLWLFPCGDAPTSQWGYCRMLRRLGVRMTVSGGPIRNLLGRVGGQRTRVVGTHSRLVQLVVAKVGHAAGPALKPGALDEGHPDLEWANCGCCLMWSGPSQPGCERARRLSRLRGHHLVRLGLWSVPACDVRGRRRRGNALPA